MTFEEDPCPKPALEKCPGCHRAQVLYRANNSWPITMLCYDCCCEYEIDRSHKRKEKL